MYSFSFPFQPWTKEKTIGEAHEIMAYLREVEAAHGTAEHVLFNQHVKVGRRRAAASCARVGARSTREGARHAGTPARECACFVGVVAAGLPDPPARPNHVLAHTRARCCHRVRVACMRACRTTAAQSAAFDTGRATWSVSTPDKAYTSSLLFSGTGYYSYDAGYVPEFEGLGDFKGQPRGARSGLCGCSPRGCVYPPRPLPRRMSLTTRTPHRCLACWLL